MYWIELTVNTPTLYTQPQGTSGVNSNKNKNNQIKIYHSIGSCIQVSHSSTHVGSLCNMYTHWVGTVDLNGKQTHNTPVCHRVPPVSGTSLVPPEPHPFISWEKQETTGHMKKRDIKTSITSTDKKITNVNKKPWEHVWQKQDMWAQRHCSALHRCPVHHLQTTREQGHV